MKNYYDTKHEIELIKLRIEVLNNNKDSIKVLVEPKSVVTDKITIDYKEISPDKNMVKYIYLLSKINKEIEIKTYQINKLQRKLESMEIYLRQIKDIKYKVFVMQYIENLPIKTIAQKLNYDKSHIYRIMDKIKKDLNRAKSTIR